MVKSNVITIEVKEKLENQITSNQLSVDKTSGYVGDTFTFTGRVKGYISDLSRYIVRIEIYVNDEYQDLINLSPSSNEFDETYTFTLTPQSKGQYSVYTNAYITALGGRI